MNKTPMKILLLASSLLLATLSGCASSAPTPIEYYVLAPPVTGTDRVVELSGKPALVLENVELAAYLRQSGMIIQTGENQLQVSRNHLWAESLDQAIPKALVRELQKQSDNYSYYIKSLDWVGQTDYRLRLQIDSFQSTDQGEVVTAGRFQLIPEKAPEAPVMVDFNFKRDLRQDGYAESVEQMNGLLGEIAAAIISSVEN